MNKRPTDKGEIGRQKELRV